MTTDQDVSAGARNLLENCAEIEAGTTLLIICEDPALGWYDNGAPEAVIAEASARGNIPTVIKVGAPENQRSREILSAIEDHECTIFFSRIGDQDRFAQLPPGKRSVMVYARDAEMLGSAFGRADHRAMTDFKTAIDRTFFGAGHIEITCPLGTRFSGSVSGSLSNEPVDVAVRRYPMSVPAPIPAAGFSGRIALAHFLTPTGSRTYDPASIQIDNTAFAEIQSGRITAFDGNTADVTRIERHYDMVAEQFGIDRNIVHSWHAGIHPACSYRIRAVDNPDRWSNTAFPNPRFVHFHTCGDYAPGEICWMVLDPTITIDGTDIWDNGRICPDRFPETAACLHEWPELKDLFADPAQSIGL